MIERAPVKQFFGDAEYEFHLSPELVMELERKTGSGIGAIYRRFLTSEFGFSDLTEIIRLGLIGADTKPADAAALVTTYAARMGVADLYLVALPIMDALMTGTAVQPVAKTRRKRTSK